MSRHIAHIATLALTLAFPAVSAVAAQQNTTASATNKGTPHFKGDNLAKDAKISLKEARAIALKSCPGKDYGRGTGTGTRRKRPALLL